MARGEIGVGLGVGNLGHRAANAHLTVERLPVEGDGGLRVARRVPGLSGCRCWNRKRSRSRRSPSSTPCARRAGRRHRRWRAPWRRGLFGSDVRASSNQAAKSRNGSVLSVKSPDVNQVGCSIEAVSDIGVPVVAFWATVRVRWFLYSGCTGLRLSRGLRSPLPAAVVVVAGLLASGCSFSYQLGSLFGKDDDTPQATAGIMPPAGDAAQKPDVTGSVSPAFVADKAVTDAGFAQADLIAASAAASAVLSGGHKDASAPWQNPKTGARGTVTPIAMDYTQDGFTCRDFLASYVSDKSETMAAGRSLPRPPRQMGGALDEALESAWNARQTSLREADLVPFAFDLPPDRSCGVAQVALRPHIWFRAGGIRRQVLIASIRRAGSAGRPGAERGRRSLGCETPMRCWGYSGRRTRVRSRAHSASSPRSCIPDANKNDPKSADKFAELNSAYEILGDEGKRKQFNAGEIDADGKPKFQGFEGFGGGQPQGGFGSGFGGQQGGAGFESFTYGPQGFRRSTGGAAGGARAGGFEDILKDMFGGSFGGAAPGGGRGGFGGAQFEPEDFGARGTGQTIAGDGVGFARRCRQRREEAREAPHRQGSRSQNSGRHRRRPADPPEGAGPPGDTGGPATPSSP